MLGGYTANHNIVRLYLYVQCTRFWIYVMEVSDLLLLSKKMNGLVGGGGGGGAGYKSTYMHEYRNLKVMN
jgi:hypothetical protein